jgi:hypothetical protein
MSRTFRRKQERHEYYWVLRDWDSHAPCGSWVRIDPASTKGRKALAHFHSDKAVTMGAAPRWYRKVFDHRIRTFNDGMLRRWLADPGFDPVFRVWHNHAANWNWW